MRQYWVRVGLVGHVGRFRSLVATPCARGRRVVCRTSRGLEIGEVLQAVQQPAESWDGELIRATTPEDELLWGRLMHHQLEALEACQRMLDQRNVPTVLMDVEPTFDGKSLYFYFLGEVSDQVSEITNELAAAYDAVAQIGRFSDVLTQGCGPECGTEGHGCDSGCAGCSVACGAGKRSREVGSSAF